MAPTDVCSSTPPSCCASPGSHRDLVGASTRRGRRRRPGRGRPARRRGRPRDHRSTTSSSLAPSPSVARPCRRCLGLADRLASTSTSATRRPAPDAMRSRSSTASSTSAMVREVVLLGLAADAPCAATTARAVPDLRRRLAAGPCCVDATGSTALGGARPNSAD